VLTFRIDTWTPDGKSIVEHVAGIEDYQVALATYRAACERWPGTPITLRQGARSSVDRLIEVLEDKVVRPAEAKFNELLARRTKLLRVENV
jgi:hypothetical protein